MRARTDILIVGAGIGGLSAALSLHAAGMTRIRVVEAAREVRALGVGLNVLPNAVRELDELGLMQRLAQCAIATGELAFYNRYGSRIWSEPRGIAAGYHWPQFSLQRRHLQHVLMEAVRERLGPQVLIPASRAVGFTQRCDGRVALELAQGPALTADLVIGADGIHSGVRGAMYPDEQAPPTNGLLMWRGTSWSRPFLTGRTMVVAGDDVRRMVFYPIAPDPERPDRVLLNWVAARPNPDAGTQLPDWDRVAHRERVLHYFGDWSFEWLDIPEIVGGSVEVYEYPMVDRDPLPAWTVGHVTLLGDAAHAMYPNGSNGATQAIMDGRVLAYHLATQSDLDAALALYEAERRPAMTQLQESNRRHGPEAVIALAHLRAPNGFENIHDVIAPSELSAFSDRYAVTGGFDIDAVNRRPSFRITPRTASSGGTIQ